MKNPEAHKLFMFHQKNALNALAKLEAWTNQGFAIREEIDWRHVGAMKGLASKLCELRDWVYGEGE